LRKLFHRGQSHMEEPVVEQVQEIQQ
jgi:hypothetical protein